MKNTNKEVHNNFAESCAKKLIHLGEMHCESLSMFWSWYEPKISSNLINKQHSK